MIVVDVLALITTELTTTEDDDEGYSYGELSSSENDDDESNTAYTAEKLTDPRQFYRNSAGQYSFHAW